MILGNKNTSYNRIYIKQFDIYEHTLLIKSRLCIYD